MRILVTAIARMASLAWSRSAQKALTRAQASDKQWQLAAVTQVSHN
jgi:hypothetical protein